MKIGTSDTLEQIKIDINDIITLERLNKKYEEYVHELNTLIQQEVELKITLFDIIGRVEMNERMSFDNKLMKARKELLEARVDIDAYFLLEAKRKQSENRLKQIEEEIKSKKKVLDLIPR